MKDAAGTRAIVVGIDAYTAMPALTGAARDAVHVVHWLRSLGVPDDRISLHAAPSPGAQAEVDALGLPVRGCTDPEIWQSFSALRGDSGERLFVVLCGHGFFEPGGERVFLTQEATQDECRNLGIEWYAAYLRGQDFRRQYLFMDGCLNLPYTASERARFLAGAPGSVALPPPRADVLQVLCCSASQGERALEDQGRGLFLSRLLEALDPGRLNPHCTSLDPATGELVLDLGLAVHEVVGPTVAAHAAQQSRQQHPTLQVLGAGPTTDRLPVVSVASPAGVSAVEVSVEPGSAASDVARLTLWSDANAWRQVLPAPPATSLTVPHRSLVPNGLPMAVRCTVAPTSAWAPPAQQELVTGGDQQVVFRLQPVAAADGLDPGGGRSFHLHHPAAAPVTALRFDLSPERARRLVGGLLHEPLLEVGERRLSLAELLREPVVPVEPGPVVVRLTLPWASWVQRVKAVECQVLPVTLPRTVGRPPLRHRLGPQALGQVEPREVVLLSPGRGQLVDVREGRLTDLCPSPRSDSSELTLVPCGDYPRYGHWRDLVRITDRGHGLVTPLNENGGLALARGAAPRAEPLTSRSSTDWDRLVSSGRLEEVPTALTGRKWSDPLFGLAGAYACLAQREHELLERVLDNLRRLDDLPDLPLLRGALDRSLGVRQDRPPEGLDDPSRVPLFRWGVGLGVLAAEHYGLGAAAARWRALEPRLVTTSVWTLWRAHPQQGEWPPSS